MVVTKEEYKKKFIDTILNLNDIIYVDMEGKENQYTLRFKKKGNLKAYITTESVEDELGMIPKNNMVYSSEDDTKFSKTMMNLAYSEQKQTFSDVFTSYDCIIKILKKGYKNNYVEYIDDIKYDSNVSENEEFNRIYNKLCYLVGQKDMDEYIKKQDKYLNYFLSEKLDQKYGEGTGLELYQSITNLSFWSTYDGEVTQEKLDNIREQIGKNNELIEQKLKDETEQFTDFYNIALAINNNYYEMLNTIDSKVSDQLIERETNFESLASFQKEIELEKLEKLTLQCINQDIDGIFNKNEALDYIKLWDYYRNTCMVGKETINEGNFKELNDVQHNLYEKCIEYGALNIQEINEKCIEYGERNIQDEQLFNKLIEAQLYHISHASISYLDGKLVISDQYVTNEVSIQEKKDGSTELKIDKQYNNRGFEGTKILADTDIPKESFTESLNTIVNNEKINEKVNEKVNEEINKRINKNIIDDVIEKRR